MRFSLRALAAVAASALLAAAAPQPRTTPADALDYFVVHGKEYPTIEGGDWQIAVTDALNGNRDVDAVAARLAPRYGMSAEQMKRLILVWVDHIFAEDLFNFPENQKPAVAARTQRELLKLVRQTGGNDLVVTLAAGSRGRDGRCDADLYAAILDAVQDRRNKGWAIVSQDECSNLLLTYEKEFPHQPVFLAQVANGDALQGAERLAFLHYMVDHFPFDRLPPADAPALRRQYLSQYLGELWKDGLVVEGLALFGAQPPDVQVRLLKGGGNAQTSIDGLSFIVDGQQSLDLTLDMAGALYVVKHDNEALAYLGRSYSAAEVQHLIVCRGVYGEEARKQNCSVYTDDSSYEWQLLDYALRTRDDPYLFLEHTFAGDTMSTHFGDGLWTMVFKRFAEAAGQRALAASRARLWAEYVNYYPDYREADRANVRALLTNETGEAWRAEAPAFQEKIDAAARALSGGAVHDVIDVHHGAGPRPSPFHEARLPTNLPGRAPAPDPAWLKTIAPLPAGHAPVRIEHDGNDVVAISVSQNLDPTGEVSEGGYWVHRSHDAGKTWDAPLYTGLAARFPYVVVGSSRLRMVAGDHLNVEVENQEIDLTSIMYPPVALQSKQHITGLYLDIPLPELVRDSDGDGVTDIMETHLLLDPHDADSDGDGVPDGRDTMPNIARASRLGPTDRALVAVLGQIFGAGFGAIVEPVDRSPDAPLLSGISGEAASYDRPIFLEGNANDFASLKPTQLMLVYSPADITRLQRMTPDFHAVRLGPIVLNRAGDRGFVVWDAGWVGGAFRLLLVNGEWRCERISDWIT